MKVASVQLNSRWEDRQYNLMRAKKFVQQAQQDRCDLVIFPEMFGSGFSMNSANIAEPADGPTCKQLTELARQHEINIIAGLVEKNHMGHQNIALTIDRTGQIQGKYIKNYPFSHAGEHLYYEAGNEQIVCQIDGVSLSTFICYDLRFPELFRKVVKDVSLMVVIASWPEVRQEHWLSLLKARAIENQCVVIGVNRTGEDGNGLTYVGGSQVINPLGQILSVADAKTEYQLTELDMSVVQRTRSQLPFLQDIKS